MYRVELYAQIRRACHVEGMSIREASRVFNLDRKTVRKMLLFSVPPGYRQVKAVPRPKLDPFTGIIDQILEEDEARPRKRASHIDPPTSSNAIMQRAQPLLRREQ